MNLTLGWGRLGGIFKNTLGWGIVLAALLVACDTSPNPPPQHHSATASGGLTISNLWGTPGLVGRVSAVYGTITNNGTEPDSLLSIQSVAAPSIEVHQMVEQDGMLRMRGMKWPVVISPGDSLALVPGGTHLMLMELPQSLKMGDSISLRLRFTGAGEREVRVVIGDRRAETED